ncbi:hypothetical protein BBJ28_00025318, partial [Nothophytophthora sp. Chile5]
MRSEVVDTQGGAAAAAAAAAATGDRASAAPPSSAEVPAVVAAVGCAADATGAATPMEVVLTARRGAGHRRSGASRRAQTQEAQEQDEPMTAADATRVQNEQRRQRHWRRMGHRELRDQLVNGMLEELQRITGETDVRHLRMCASRYESFVWKKSANQVQYKEKLERRIESLRRQPSPSEAGDLDVRASVSAGFGLNLNTLSGSSPDLPAAAAAALDPCPRRHLRAQQQQQDEACSLMATLHRHDCHSSCPDSHKAGSKRAGKRQKRSSSTSSVSSTCSTSSLGSPPSRASPAATSAHRDELYFGKLRAMKSQYRDEVALVFRELCRVNTVIQHSASLRHHESNNLGDFLANLKKIIYLLEQQPGEACGMIPARKRTVEYLDVVESHIQRKVLPILHRLRHTYSTILRPIVLNYMRNSYRFSRRLKTTATMATSTTETELRALDKQIAELMQQKAQVQTRLEQETGGARSKQ